MVEPVIYCFSDETSERAKRVGNARQAYHDARGTPNSYGLRASRAESARINRAGALAELCVAEYFGVADHWVEVTDDYHGLKGDVVPGLEVRSTRWPHGGVLLHPKDDDDRLYVSVRTHEANTHQRVQIVGWVSGRVGKQEKWWDDPQPGRFCYVVPADALRPVQELVVTSEGARYAETAF